jgi:glycosyltransferase involved in cell wall biosynthesis
LLARSIHSVLNQTYPDFEVLVIDDGSADDTAGVVAGFRDERIRYVRLENNGGPGAARNLGIRMAKAKFIAFQDSDDEWLAEKLAKHMSVFERSSPRLGVVYSDMQRVRKDGSVTYHASPAMVPRRLVNPVQRFYEPYMLGIQSTVMKRECFDAAGFFNEQLSALEDLELFIRLSKAVDFYRIPEPLVRYYETDGLSKNRRAGWLARKSLLRLYYKELLVQDAGFLIKECLWICKTRLAILNEKLRRARVSASS